MALDLEIIDSHHHLCDLTHSYPWLEGPAFPFRYHGDDRPIRKSYSIEDYLGDFKEFNLVGSIHIENGAGDPFWETAWVDSVHRANGIPSAIVAKIDLSSPDAEAQMEKHAQYQSVRGIRDILNWHPDPVFTHRDRNDLMRDPVWRKGYSTLHSYNLSFDLQVFPSQLKEAAGLIDDFPDTQVILDHAGMPIGRDPESVKEWRDGMKALADRDQVTVKISALGTNDHQWTVGSLRPFILDTIEIFGPERCMFGSNFPVDSLYSTLTQLFTAFDEVTSGFSQTERRALFADTARKVYRLDH